MRTIDSSHDRSEQANALSGLFANCSSRGSNRRSILRACLALRFFGDLVAMACNGGIYSTMHDLPHEAESWLMTAGP